MKNLNSEFVSFFGSMGGDVSTFQEQKVWQRIVRLLLAVLVDLPLKLPNGSNGAVAELSLVQTKDSANFRWQAMLRDGRTLSGLLL